MIDNEKDKLTEESIEKHRADLRIVSDRVSQSYCAVLKKGREKKGLSIMGVASELKVPSYIIVALEEQQYEKLPNDTYVTGYIRAYSDLLGLNPDGLIKDYKQDKAFRLQSEYDRIHREENKRLANDAVNEPGFEKSLKYLRKNVEILIKEKGLKFLVLSLVVLVFSYVAVEYFGNSTENNVKASKGSPFIESVKIQNADGSIVVTDIMDDAKHTPVVSADSMYVEDRLKFVFSGTSWVTVRDEGGNLLHQSRERKGEVMELTGKAPFFIRLSNASSVTLMFNGKSQDFRNVVTDDDQVIEFRVPPLE